MDIETLQEKIRRKKDEAINDVESLGNAALPVLTESLHHDDPEVRALAVGCLSVIYDEQVTGMLVEAIGDNDERVYMGSLQILQGKQINIGLLPALSRHINHPDARIREGVALLLGKFGNVQMGSSLRRQLEDETDPQALRGIRLALARLGDKEKKNEFIKGLFAEQAEDRLQALEDIEYIGDKTTAGDLLPLLDDTADGYEIGDPDEPEYTRLCDITINLISGWYEKPFDFEIDEAKIYDEAEIEKARKFIESLGEKHDGI